MTLAPARAPVPAPGTVVPAAGPRRRVPALPSTPVALLMLLALLLVTAAGLAAALTAGVSHARTAVATIGHDRGPVIIAAQKISFSLADMDASLANELLVGTRTDLGQTAAQARAEYATDRREVTDQLAVLAADPASRPAVDGLLDGVATYEGEVAQAEQAADLGRNDEAVARYQSGTDLLHGTLLPAAAALNSSTLATIEATYDGSAQRSRHDEAVLVAAGLATFAVLVGAQLLLTRRTRRLLHPGLLAAALVAAGLTVAGAAMLAQARSDLHGVKQDAFDSVVALSEARSIAYDANADESRFLIDPARTASYQQQYVTKSLQIVDLGAGTTIANVDARLAAAVQAAEQGTVTFGGSLGVELRNITFPGERAAALAALTTFAAYERDDRMLRAMVAAGQRDAAVRYDTGTAADQSDGAFVAFDAALTKVLGINTTFFGSNVRGADATLSPWGTLPLAGVLAIVALGAAGIGVRLREFRG